MTITASDWNGRPIDAGILIAAFGLKITPAPSGPAWRLAHIDYSHGIPRLRTKFRGSSAPGGVTWTSIAGLNIYTATSFGEAGLDVNFGSYYTPSREPGPWRIDPDGPSDVVAGVGMAIGIQPQPSAEEDNRYLLPVLTFEWNEGGTTPPPPPPPGSPGVSRADLEHLRTAFVTIRNHADSQVDLLNRILDGVP